MGLFTSACWTNTRQWVFRFRFNSITSKCDRNVTNARSGRKVRESRMAGAHATMWIACRMPDWLYFGDFDLVSKQIEMAGARSKCFGDFDARIEMDRNRSN